MTVSPLVSVVTPSYNQARFLEQTICSVLDQEYPQLEYFVIDGGSTDGSEEIIYKYAKRLKGWVSEKDAGQADAINKGFKRAQGEIVAWLNSDDYFLPGAVSTAVTALQEHPDAGFVYGNVLSVDEDSHSFNLQTFRSHDLTDLMTFHMISQPAVFMRRAILDRAGMLDLSYQCLLDHHLWLRMVRIAPIIYIPETLAAARYHPEAKNRARTLEFGKEAYRLVEWMRNSSEYSTEFSRYSHRIWAGAYRLDAFYLLDGDQPLHALAAYSRAFIEYPPVVIKEIHRVVFSVLSLFGLGRLREVFMRIRSRLRAVRTE